MQPEIKQASLNKSHIQRQFDRSATQYDHVASMQKTIANDLLSYSKLSRLPANIIDAGCGTGYGLEILIKSYPRAIFKGLDLSSSMLKEAQKNYPQAEFKQGDIEQLPFEDEAFDLTWSSSAIQWCDADRAIGELVRVTQAGGQILLSTFTAGTLQDWRALWSLQDSQRFDSVEKVESAFMNAGVSNVRLLTKVYTQTFTSFKSAVSSIRDLGAGNAEENRSRGLLGVQQYKRIKAQIDQTIADHGQLELPYFVTFVVAEKE